MGELLVQPGRTAQPLHRGRYRRVRIALARSGPQSLRCGRRAERAHLACVGQWYLRSQLLRWLRSHHRGELPGPWRGGGSDPGARAGHPDPPRQQSRGPRGNGLEAYAQEVGPAPSPPPQRARISCSIGVGNRVSKSSSLAQSGVMVMRAIRLYSARTWASNVSH